MSMTHSVAKNRHKAVNTNGETTVDCDVLRQQGCFGEIVVDGALFQAVLEGDQWHVYCPIDRRLPNIEAFAAG